MLREKTHTDEAIGAVITKNFPDAKHNDAGIVKYHRAKHNRLNPDDVLVQMVMATVRGKEKLVERDSVTPEEKSEKSTAKKVGTKKVAKKASKKVSKKKVAKKKKK